MNLPSITDIAKALLSKNPFKVFKTFIPVDIEERIRKGSENIKLSILNEQKRWQEVFDDPEIKIRYVVSVGSHHEKPTLQLECEAVNGAGEKEVFIRVYEAYIIGHLLKIISQAESMADVQKILKEFIQKIKDSHTHKELLYGPSGSESKQLPHQHE